MTDIGPLSPLAGTWVVMRRELRALLQDRRSIWLMVIFGLLFPVLIGNGTLSHRTRPELVLGVMTQVLVFPYIAGLQAALTTFVGEREHGTLGPLLATPLSNVSIFAGKLLGAAFLPSLATSAIGFAAFISFARTKAAVPLRLITRGTFAETIALAVVAGFAMIVAGVLLGSKAKSVRGAQGISTVVVLPVVFGVQLLGTLVFEHSMLLGWMILLALAAGIAAALALSARIWNREEALVST